jgi:hypothetical protein
VVGYGLGSFARTTRKRPRTKDDDDDEDDLGNGGIKTCDCCIEAINQAGQHCYDTGKHFVPGANAIDRDEAFGDRRVKAGGALECRATGVIEKLGPLLTLTLAVSFGPVFLLLQSSSSSSSSCSVGVEVVAKGWTDGRRATTIEATS